MNIFSLYIMSELMSISREINEDAEITIKDAFQEPRKKFWMRSRKRLKSDAVSVSSMDISIESEVGKKKKRRRITEVASNIFSSATPANKIANTLHRSFTIPPSAADLSFVDTEIDPGTSKKKSKTHVESSNNLILKSWILDVANSTIKLSGNLSRKEVKRQEAIYELYCGENVLLNDLCMLKDFYYEPLRSTGILTPKEMQTIFGDTEELIRIHTKLRDELLSLRDENGFTESVGLTILNWVSLLPKPYLERCRTQIWAKALMDEKRLTNRRFHSFLKKRMEMPHSVDLWTYIDVPRSRIVKYPLLVREILRHTPPSHSDETVLIQASGLLSDLLNNINKAMGDAECKLAQSKIHLKAEYDPSKCVERATELITEGQLKDSRGMKYQCFLFDTGFALTRRARLATKKYTLSLPVIPNSEISVDDSEDNSIGASAFKIGDYILATEDGHGKRHWMECFHKIQKSKISPDEHAYNTDDKENHPNYTPRKVKESTRLSMGSMSENHFSLTLKKSFFKHKRSSIGYI